MFVPLEILIEHSHPLLIRFHQIRSCYCSSGEPTWRSPSFEMRIASICFVLAQFVLSRSQGQNIVPNPGFEEYNGLLCNWYVNPNLFGANMVGWSAPTEGTSDLFSLDLPITCYSHPLSTFSGPPYNSPIGRQQPHAGNNMGGLHISPLGCGGVPNYREYLMIELSEPLVIGEIYCASLWWSLADRSSHGANGLSMAFLEEPISSNSCAVYPGVTPQVVSTTVMLDTMEWQQLSGSFEATTAAQYLVVGSFWADALTTYEPTNAATAYPSTAFYYIDDVVVEHGDCLNEVLVIPDTICPGELGVLVATGNGLVSWVSDDAPGDVIWVGDTLEVAPLETTTYLALGTDTLSVELVVLPAADVSLGPDLLLCPGMDVTVDAIGNWEELFWNGETAPGLGSLTISQPGVYWVQVFSGNCSSTDSVIVAEGSAPDGSLTQLIVGCEGGEGLVQVTGQYVDLYWGNGAQDSEAWFPSGSTATAVITSAEGCLDTLNLPVIFNVMPTAGTFPDLQACQGSTVELGGSMENLEVIWPGGFEGLEIAADVSGEVMVIVANQCGSDTARFDLRVEDCSIIVHVPNSFTPNGDGINDRVGPSFSMVPESFEFTIFDRWGRVVFSTSLHGQAWDGLFSDGSEVPIGVYVYALRYRQESQRSGDIRGHITLLR